VDRIDSDGVYIPYNSTPCCATCDFMKGLLLAASSEFLAKAKATLYIHKKQAPHDSNRTAKIQTRYTQQHQSTKQAAGTNLPAAGSQAVGRAQGGVGAWCFCVFLFSSALATEWQ
jgi:hypothetical protein